MKVSCILTSFNRPRWVKHALASVANQTHPDFELIVVDESTHFDIYKTLREYSFPRLAIIHYTVSEKERHTTNRLSINVNKGLRAAKGDLICFLADDDYFFPEWFKGASKFFESNPSIGAGFGRLFYSSSKKMDFSKKGRQRFFHMIIPDPYCKLDHNQIIHRKITPPLKWCEEMHAITAPDGLYAREVAKKFPFHPIHVDAAVKRMHPKNLQPHIHRHGVAGLGGLRE